MGILQTWNDVLESVGGFAGDIYKKTRYFREINEPILDLTCTLWAKYPKSIVFNPYARGFANNICAQIDVPLPEKSPPPYSGGQCEGIEYNIDAVITRQFNNNDPQTYDAGTMVLYGPITGVELRQNPDVQTSFIQIASYGYDAAGNEDTDSDNIGGVGFRATINSITITRSDGLPDTCGDRENEYPNDPPRDPNDFTRNVTINNYNNNGDVVGNTTIQMAVDVNADLSFPITVDVGGIDINVGLDGYSTNDDGVPKPEVEERRLPLPDSGELEETEGEEEESDEKEFEEILVWVKLRVTVKPKNAKTQFGNAGPDVFYCGWFEFVVEGHYLNRVPIHWENNIFLAPERATGYAYTLYEGFSGVAKAYTEKREIEPDEPV